MIIETLVENRERLMGDKELDTLLKVAFRFYDKNLLEQNIAHSIHRALTNGHTYGYSIDTQCK